MPLKYLRPSRTRSFADIAHQSLVFDTEDPTESFLIDLIDTKWVQRLRTISQTGNTKLVYMFAEHSRFGHSLGVAYLANLLMKSLMNQQPDIVSEYRPAVASAALLHDIGHVAPGSHLGEKIWSDSSSNKALHESLTARIIREDQQLSTILGESEDNLLTRISGILDNSEDLPSWTRAIISGGGWNADRGNWAIVDSAMCCVSYGRYNVLALIDAFRLTDDGQLVLLESRLDALTHFFVARDSMYRQVYQHRVLQSADALSANIVYRLKDILTENNHDIDLLDNKGIFLDETMQTVLCSSNYSADLPLEEIFKMNESWWFYHVCRWCDCDDTILKDLSLRLRDRQLFKTIRLSDGTDNQSRNEELIDNAKRIAEKFGYNPRYYVAVIEEADKHREKLEEPPLALLDNGSLVPVSEIEPLIDQIIRRSESRRWIAVPKEVKKELGLFR